MKRISKYIVLKPAEFLRICLPSSPNRANRGSFRFTTTVFFILFSLSFAHAQQCNVIYVTNGGASSGTAGSKTTPASLTYALNTLANATDNKIYMASGTYNISVPLNMKSNISIEGGFDPATWKKSNSTATTIYRDNSNVEANPSRIVAMYCSNISNFRLQDLTIRTANAFGGGISTYTVHMNGCSNYQIVRCKIFAGNAGNGSTGTNGTNGTAGADGAAGGNGDKEGPCCRAGGAGGFGNFSPSFGGGTGGDGGERGTGDCALCGDPNFASNGYPGQSGQATPPGGGGYGGNGGAKILTCVYPTTPPASFANDGKPGTDGANGLPGTPGADGIASYTGGFYQPANGSAGSIGTNGHGGGGGGGGGSLGGITICNFPGWPNLNGTGAGGGGGGEGGQYATGATGGTGGGGSFALYINNNGAGGVIKDTKLTSGVSGIGGIGGIGGTGGTGGTGGDGGVDGGYVGNGGDGGNGGKGGDGGAGGKGSDGESYTLYESTGGTAVALQNIYSLQQPFVYVQYSGCTNAPVTFSTNASGTVIWFFGAGASPASGNGVTATTKYTTTGRKTFTMVNNGISYTFSDFIEIFSTGNGMTPSITSADSNICKGASGNYTCSTAADSYLWNVVKDSTLDTTIAGATFQNLNFTFDSAGTYTIFLKSVNICCGESFPDTFTVMVEDIFQPEISIVSENPTNTVCLGGSFTFSASISVAGANPSYQWLVNGVAAGGNYPVYTSSSLNDGDVVECVVTSSLGCSTGQQDTSNSLSVTVIDLPVVTCTADSFFSGEPTNFSATVTSGGLSPFTYNWSFGDTSLGFGSLVSHIYQQAGTYNYQVNVLDSNGCSGNCSGTVVISTKLKASFSASVTSGCAPLQVDFSNYSVYAITYLWNFGDGTTSIQQNPTHLYTNSGTYTVTLMAFGASGTDSSTVSSQVFVYPQPVANFQAYPQVITELGDTVFFADNSVDAWTWFWDFFDGTTDTTQNPIHIYSDLGNYDVMLVVTNGYGCTDTTFKGGFVIVDTTLKPPGVGEKEFEVSGFRFLVFPNPFNAEININLNAETSGVFKTTLTNTLGQVIVEEKNNVVAGQTKKIFRPQSLNSGLYFLELDFNGNKQYVKLIYKE